MSNNSCVFCSVASREKESSIVFEDDISVAFLDHRPLFPGHCLLIPKAHLETIADLPVEIIGPLFINAQRLSAAVQEAMGADGIFIAQNNKISQSVPHFHVHIVPRRKGDGLKGFFWPRTPYRDDAHMAEVRDAIIEKLRSRSSAI